MTKPNARQAALDLVQPEVASGDLGAQLIADAAYLRDHPEAPYYVRDAVSGEVPGGGTLIVVVRMWPYGAGANPARVRMPADPMPTPEQLRLAAHRPIGAREAS